MNMDTKKSQTMNIESLNMLNGVIEPGAAINIATPAPSTTVPSKSGSSTVWYFIVGAILLVILFVYLQERNKIDEIEKPIEPNPTN